MPNKEDKKSNEKCPKNVKNINNSSFNEKKINLNLILGLIIFEVMIYFYLIPNNVSSLSNDAYGLGADFMPKLWTSIMFLASLIYLILILIKPKSIEVSKTIQKWSKTKMYRGLLVIVYIAFYLFILIDLLGFYFSTPLFLIGSYFLLGERRIFVILSTAFFLTISIFVIFEKFLNISLPKGIIF
ncbi:MAG: tripartite tricarboxylate transporter TctB family protein [Candidatus Helarchaeota archaeon]